MKINLYNIYYYYLTCNNKIRKEHITNEFKNFKLVEVNPIMNIGKTKSGATGFSRILDQACIDQDKNKPFQPFGIFEDDAKKFDEFPLDIEIPDDTDILFIGLSARGMGIIRNKVKDCNTVCRRTINDNIIRIYNMLSLHGIIVCSIRGLLTLQKCMFESYYQNKIWDIYTAEIQPYLNVYALKKPLVYQYGEIGGIEEMTKIDYVDKTDIPLPNEWINKNNLSILTMNKNNITALTNKSLEIKKKTKESEKICEKDSRKLNKKITCFSYSNNNSVYSITYPILNLYCGLHNYEFIPYFNNLEKEKYKPHWNKLHYSIKLLKESKSEYLVWFDHDIVIKNFDIKLEEIIYKYKFNECKALFMMSQDPVIKKPFNSGVIVMKNTSETLNIFSEFLNIRDKKGCFDFKNGFQDTRVMDYYFNLNKTKLLSIPHKILQSFYGMSNFYSIGDFCGHVAGPQNEELINYLNELINLKDNKKDNKKEINSLLKDLGPIEKKIHISWKTKDILDLDFFIIKQGIRKLKDLNPEYIIEISNDEDVEKFIKKHISNNDYHLIKDRDIVEKTDLWRLLKIYHEGGFYMDIDRLCNIPLKNIIKSEHKCILPMYHDIDFSQDIMISSSNNIIFKEAIDLNLKRRQDGCKDIITLGPITYFHAITNILLGKQIPRYPSVDNLFKLRQIINNCKYLSTFREVPPYHTIIYIGPYIPFDKNDFYRHFDVNHWTIRNRKQKKGDVV